jgi:hypothetical protein
VESSASLGFTVCARHEAAEPWSVGDEMMSDLSVPEHETVYVAGTVREVELLAQLFEEQGIEYEIRRGQFIHVYSFNGAFAGLFVLVLPGQAEYCRVLLSERGFTKGIVPAGVELQLEE